MNKSFENLYNYVNSNYDIRELYYKVTGHKAGNGKVFCPFHHNVNTPAAKIYENTMMCFGSCHKLYKPYDFLSKFFPDELKKVKETIIIPDSKSVSNNKFIMLSQFDLNNGLYFSLKKIINNFK